MFNIQNDFILRTDSYKFSHWKVYPENTEFVTSYMESRGGEFPETVMFGTSIILPLLTTRITAQMVEYARDRTAQHFGDKNIFNYDGWMRVVNECDGLLPLSIKAVPEGTVVPTRNVLMTVQNTKAGFGWLTNHFETYLLRLWYPITVATLSRECKKIIARHLEISGDPSLIDFKLHDFGARGVSSEESAGIGGAAHLVNFMGTDTFMANELVYDVYKEPMAGYSIPATEHAVMSIFGESGEIRQMERFLDVNFDSTAPAAACVSDTFNIFKACSDKWGGELRAKVIEFAKTGKFLVVRPDSGDPPTVVRQVVELLGEKFGYFANNKGYKVLNCVRVIQGDGINIHSIERILTELEVRGWSADNIAFGMGGALLQMVNRDTLKFAFKACSMVIGGKVYDEIHKDPITDSGKRSKRGRLKLILDEDGVFTTVRMDESMEPDELVEVFRDGEILEFPTFQEIRNRAQL